jgi:hypothetical protein
MEEDKVVIVIERGVVAEAYSTNAGLKLIIVDHDVKNNGGKDYISELTWPDTQYDDERVEELLAT